MITKKEKRNCGAAVLRVAKHYTAANPATLSTIASRSGCSKNYVGGILRILSQLGLVQTKRKKRRDGRAGVIVYWGDLETNNNTERRNNESEL